MLDFCNFACDSWGLWESINNPNFKVVEFDSFKNEADLCKVCVKNDACFCVKILIFAYGGGVF